MVILWYGLVPAIGALIKRYKWHIFRKHFDELRLSPILDYIQYSRQEMKSRTFRFVGGFESVTDGHILWIRNEDLTIPVYLQNAETYLLPMQKSASFGKGEIPEVFDPEHEAPEEIRWKRVSALTEGAKVFVGGLLVYQDERWSFVSSKETPLMVIFYDGADHSLATRTIRAGRHGSEYWNGITPYSLIIGALCQILIAVMFLSRPAFRLTVIVALIALFVPLYPMIPPGLLFTVAYRRLAWRARILRAYRDLARLPLRYLAAPGKKGLRNIIPLKKAPQISLNNTCILPNGELYGYTCKTELPPQMQDIPLLLPEFTKTVGRWPSSGKRPPHSRDDNLWYIFGALRQGKEMPVQPQDSFATFGILPGRPETIARRCEITAYLLELVAWFILCMGIGLNIFFLRMIMALL